MNWIRMFFFGWTKQWIEGDDAYRDGKSEDSNPYLPTTHSWNEWRRGFYGQLVLLALALGTLQMSGCAGCRNELKHMQSDWTGLDRTITLYGATGEPIRTWKTQAKVEDRGGSCYFLDADGKSVIVSGAFVIEEN